MRRYMDKVKQYNEKQEKKNRLMKKLTTEFKAPKFKMSIFNLVEALKVQRYWSVQNEKQYGFIYKYFITIAEIFKL